MNRDTRFVFVTGGVVSSLGKGITAASIALLLRQRGYRVSMQKLDPYLNVDPGTMSPYQHGEVYVTDDGSETDLDLGHYERFAGITCSSDSNYTAGRIYSNVISREREGGYLGKTVQVIPHVTDEIKNAVLSQKSPEVDIAITEVGGTIGDIESLPFLEALRQLARDLGRGKSMFVHLTLLPYLSASGEMKTKPTQRSVGTLRGLGIIPDVLICRTEEPMEEEHYEKLSLFCSVPRYAVVEERNVEHSIYEVPVELAEQGVDTIILDTLGLAPRRLDLTEWNGMLRKAVSPSRGTVRIAVVGKYMSLRDSYKSIFEALKHGAIANDVELSLTCVEAEQLQGGKTDVLRDVHGILVPGGFGHRGIEGKLEAVCFAREKDIPYFGICLGMQCAVIETARNLLGLGGANSTEFDPDTAHPVISLMDEQKNIVQMGGTMRLGAYPCELASGSRAALAYGSMSVSERHRHRFEFNNGYREQMERAGISFTGLSPDGALVEIIERKDHPWFLACQFHPEFRSKPLDPHPLFSAFIAAAAGLPQ